MPQWLPILSRGSIILGLATAAVIAIDIPPPRRAGAGRPTPASVNVAKGRRADLKGSPREGTDCAPSRHFIPGTNGFNRPKRHYAKRSISACASAISGISGVGEKPSSAGASTAWASAGRPVDW
jgi:hypothetical protein